MDNGMKHENLDLKTPKSCKDYKLNKVFHSLVKYKKKHNLVLGNWVC